MENVRNTYKISLWEPVIKWSFEEPRIKGNRIKLNLYEAGWEDEGTGLDHVQWQNLALAALGTHTGSESAILVIDQLNAQILVLY